MATIVNNPPASDSSGGLMGVIIGLIVLSVLVYLGFVYGLPALQQMRFGSPQINIPSKIDVNINQPK
ncbi:hypothetical protein A3J19_04800 [Candidatus Daviesbacteria bacterium RIFCSPLOWO2_02_FULL_41_8]|uniref:Uncharacterized protein n=3 Tax=Candidatus Daviesiibacteriota TaxID=1752718 RepID=A0A1F5NH77_9BACT|nr:MAG: hypothetical protein A2871_02535 [Candidatus Daviesbacteria bacterium RIFCSPHIGHO2_01_FULL_41_23]OGE33788.1 MAG: hypothetical protein A3D83_04410 [Candidatus Daviesbacteria bacterium RIFCSPHIGHO2_02_FULL_41_10]OGE62054.1 MAG: hypothetical protein A2967_00150 [Candidatus Daviesbacteria bacterium RIFCSPLOWO2_01_FULL_41_32]OGE77019.1 MAG: hypothetical protein A3J19_04800 [Candidatus Daviesbacteria bacterium RIFCSPLOWO2_02_FULL_41_8]